MKIKAKTKRNLIRLMTSIMFVFIVLNLAGVILGFGSKSYAAGFGVESLLSNGTFAALSIAMAGLPFVLVTVLKLVIILIGLVLQILMSGAFSSLESNFEWASLSDIIFAGSEGASQFLDVNFFDLNVGDTALQTFRGAVAKWYYILRLISAAILLVILIYVGIRMALSTIASEQAKYKQMITDWVVSLALLFVLHYIIIFAITVNSSLVNALAAASEDCTGDMMSKIVGMMFWPGIEGLFAAIVYAVYVGQTFSFFLLYMKRMIMVGFLIMIAPLITITYSIDKIGDGKAQALNAWLKELVYNILIQPFHCVIFMAFFDAIAKMIGEKPFSIGAYIFAIVVMQFMKKAEEILRKIFHFEASSMSSLKESGQSIANTTGTFVKTGMVAGAALSNFKATGGFKNAKENWQQFKVDRKNQRDFSKAFKKQKKYGILPDGVSSFKEYQQSDEGKEKFERISARNAADMKKQVDAKRATKVNKNREKYDNKHGAGAYDEMIEKRAEESYDSRWGKGEYKKMKKRATEVDRDGKPTPMAKLAQDSIKAEKEETHDKFIKEGGAGVKRTIKNGWAHTGGAAYRNMRQFAGTGYGKVVMAATKDSTRIAAAIGMGAVGLGGGDLKDAISLGQTGYGFATGLLKNSTGTLVKDSTEKAQQIAALTGKDPSDETVIQNILAQVKSDKQAGLLDPKAITAKLDQLENTITSLYANRKEGHIDFSQFRTNLQAAAAQGNLSSQEISRLIEQQFSDFDKDDKKNIEVSATNYINTVLMSGVATNQTTLENAGFDTDEHDAKVTKRASTTTFSS